MFASIAPAADLTIRGDDLLRVGPLGWIAPGVVPEPPDPAVPLIDPEVTDTATKILRGLSARGAAAGFQGLVYDNRDAEHSSLPQGLFPQLTRLRYGERLDAANLDHGLGGQILLPTIVFGNSSTARTSGPTQRSLTRIAMTEGDWPARAFRAYAANHIFVYPEHRDHDAVDLYPANWPYMITSQGSSGSDQVFLRAIAMTLAAFPPETRQAMERANLVAPTLQMILRRSLDRITSRLVYLSGKAHPTVFDGTMLSPERMISLAAALRPEDIPPMVRLSVLEEEFSDQAGLGDMSERLFDTPSAIARLWRRLEGRSEMLVSAEDTQDITGRGLSFSWVLLRGDPDKVRIEPMDEKGRAARITVDWHDAQPIAGSPTSEGEVRLSSRVDIGVFAWNGAYDSAPAFVSISFPTHQIRDYALGADGVPRLVSVDYDAFARKVPFDPLLYWTAPWRDVFEYDAVGAVTGWQRETGEGAQTFDAADQTRYRVTNPQSIWPSLKIEASPNTAGEARSNR